MICKLVKSIFFFLLLYYREQWLGVHVLVERSWRLTAGRASHAAVWLSEYAPGWRSRNVQKTSRVCPSMIKTVTVPSLFVCFLVYSPWKKSSRFTWERKLLHYPNVFGFELFDAMHPGKNTYGLADHDQCLLSLRDTRAKRGHERAKFAIRVKLDAWVESAMRSCIGVPVFVSLFIHWLCAQFNVIDSNIKIQVEEGPYSLS